MFSKACEYGIKAAILIAQESKEGRRISLKAIAQNIDSPVAFTAKILQSLSKEKVIKSVQGPLGGYEMCADDLDRMTLSRVVLAIDGDQLFYGCGLGLANCNADKPCPVHDQFVVVRDHLKSMLENSTMSDLAAGIAGGLTFLKR